VGAVPGGAIVEVGVGADKLQNPGSVTFVLNEPDYTTSQRIADAINQHIGTKVAAARDAAAIEVQVPDADIGRPVAFFARLENVTIEPDRRAKVVINERTGTVVSGGDVRISKVAISHGDLKISVTNFNAASQPNFVSQTGPGVRTAIVTNTRIEVDEMGPTFLAPTSSTVADLVQSLARLKTSTRDIISILRAVKAAGALHAELVVQ
jgi:flagellar P-ring protein precursor FlgI